MTDWILAIDYGTTHTAAAVLHDGKVERLMLDDGQGRMASPVLVGEDGTVYVGRTAQRQLALSPDRYVREPKSLLGKFEVETIGGDDYPITALVGKVLETVLGEAVYRYGGTPTEVRLTHPVSNFGPRRQEALRTAAAVAGIEDPVLVPEPEAAAFALAANLSPGEKLAVYDLGGGTFDTAVLERTDDGFELSGEPEGMEVGGERFDDRLLAYIGETVAHDEPEAWAELRAQGSRRSATDIINLRAAVREAKEDLSNVPSLHVMVPFERESVQVRREELEELIEEHIEETFAILERTIAGADVDPRQLQGVYLTGGSSRINLVGETARNRYGDRVFTNTDPKAVVANGALEWRPASAPIGSGLGPDRPRQTSPPSNELLPYEGHIRAQVPAGWYVKSDLTAIEPSGSANVIASVEAVGPNISMAGFCHSQGELLAAEFPGYRQHEVTEMTTFGLPGLRRLFEWRPPDAVPVKQIQIYQVSGGRSFVATATSPVDEFDVFGGTLEEMLAAVASVPSGGLEAVTQGGVSTADRVLMGLSGSYARRRQGSISTVGYTPELRLSAPVHWFVKESVTILAPTGEANLLASAEPLAPGIDSRAYFEEQGRLLSAEFPYYAETSQAEYSAFGRPGFSRSFAWKPPDGVRVAQTQIYFAEAGRGFVATATTPATKAKKYQAELAAAFEGLALGPEWGRPGAEAVHDGGPALELAGDVPGPGLGSAIEQLHETVRGYLGELADDVPVDHEGRMMLRHESAQLFVSCGALGDGTAVGFTAPLLIDVPASVEIYKYVAVHADDYAFGSLSVVEREHDLVDLFFTHYLVGESLKSEDLQRVAIAILTTANDIDDELQARFGGRRYYEDGDDA